MAGAAIAWLCWRLLEQDQQLESQRTLERLERAADRSSAAWTAELAELDAWLPRLNDANAQRPPAGIVTILKTGAGTRIAPEKGLIYLPAARSEDASDHVFARGERLEFEDRDPEGAAAVFRALAASQPAARRAGALLRLGRNLRKLGRNLEALRAYDQLSRAGEVSIDGMPAELIALSARCSVLQVMGRRAELKREALRLDAALRSRRWALGYEVWEFHRAESRQWAETPPLSAAEREALSLSRAAEWVDQLWPRAVEPEGRRLIATEDGPVLAWWKAGEAALSAVLVAPARVQALWKRAQAEGGVATALVDANGKVIMGGPAASRTRVVRSPAAPGMAAALVATLKDPAEGLAGAAIRRRFLLAGFALLALTLAGGCYFMVRYTARERAVTRMQTEFVAAVSHEFRTPLTSIRQLSEMLAERRLASEDERMQSYRVLAQAAERLQRLVESLLDFGRMEAAAFRYRFDPLNVCELVESIVESFRQQGAQGHLVELTNAPDVPPVRGDRESLYLALWNLLDNAVKYSPGCPSIRVETRREGAGSAIAVRDNGPGVEKAEQERIFEKFTRGTAARKSNAKGTGIGLNMARHIARAHGGDIRVSSRPGEGSTFTLYLPGKATE